MLFSVIKGLLFVSPKPPASFVGRRRMRKLECMITGTAGFIPLSPEAAKKKIQNAVRDNAALQILDVRSQAEFSLHYLPGSKLIPLNELENRANELNPGREILVVCQFGLRSGAACELLEAKGFSRLYNLKDGIQYYPGLVLGCRALERSIAG